MKNKIIKQNGPQNSIIMYTKQSKYSIIWLHGLGDTSEGFHQFFQNNDSPIYHGARIKLLQAPQRAVTVNGGQQCNSWYDIKTFQFSKNKSPTDEQMFSMSQVKQSYNIIEKEVESQIEFWKKKFTNSKISPYQRIFIGGFSQGCAMSIYYGLQCKNPIAGVIAYSGHFFNSAKLTNLQKTKFIIFHGKEDPLINQAKTKQQYKPMIGHSNTIYHAIEDLQHSVNLFELKQTTKWILQIVNNSLKQ